MRSKTRAYALGSLAFCGLVLLAGCDAEKLNQAVDELHARHAKPVDPFATDAVAQAAAELEGKLGTPVRALDLEVSEHRIVFQVQDPAKPENVDAYELRNGELLGPQPVQLIGGGDLETNLYPLAEIPLARIPELAQAALAAMKLEGGKVSSLRVHRKLSFIPPEVQAKIDASRRRAGIEAEAEDPEARERDPGRRAGGRALRRQPPPQGLRARQRQVRDRAHQPALRRRRKARKPSRLVPHIALAA